jgi:hypothetical protein
MRTIEAGTTSFIISPELSISLVCSGGQVWAGIELAIFDDFAATIESKVRE